MKAKVTLETYIDIPDSYLDIPYILNSDTEQEYRDELKCMLLNGSSSAIWDLPMKSISEDCIIKSAEPYEDGIDEFEKFVEKWKTEYYRIN